jgi:hypothetical protein
MYVEGVSLRDRGPFRLAIEAFADTNMKRKLILVLGNKVLQGQLL